MKPLILYCRILLLITIFATQSFSYSYAQAAHSNHLTHNFKDSVELENLVTFDQAAIAYKDNKTTYAKVVKFSLKITNNSHAVIPDPLAYKGSKFVKLYINGQLNMPKKLFDESETPEDKDNIIAPGESQTFYCDWLQSNRNILVRKYGQSFVAQFVYIGILSPRVYVNLATMTVKILPHRHKIPV